MLNDWIAHRLSGARVVEGVERVRVDAVRRDDATWWPRSSTRSTSRRRSCRPYSCRARRSVA
jgi:hypothetical protein